MSVPVDNTGKIENVVCSDGKVRKARLNGLNLFGQCCSVSVNGKTVTGKICEETIGSFYGKGKVTGRRLFLHNFWGKNSHLLPEFKLPENTHGGDYEWHLRQR